MPSSDTSQGRLTFRPEFVSIEWTSNTGQGGPGPSARNPQDPEVRPDLSRSSHAPPPVESGPCWVS